MAMQALEKAAKEIEGMPLYIDDCTQGLTLRRFKSETRKMVRKFGIKIVMVDFAQLMDVSDIREDRYDLKVSAVSHGMKMLAKELNIHVMVATQLNREGMKNTAGEPRMENIKESGTLAEDADYILGLWNPAVKKADEANTEKISEAARTINIRVLKHRHGGGKGQRADVMMLPGRCKMVALTKEHFEMNLEDEPDGEVNIDGADGF
jgi:replicative DNA helicase